MMLTAIDWPLLFAGLLLGLVLGTVIILFLIYAAVNASRTDSDVRSHYLGSVRWSSVSKYETQRAHMHALGHDPEAMEW